MQATTPSTNTESSDQELVDLYAAHAGRDSVTDMTDDQIQEASHAAYSLELRGHIEQAGIWLHTNRPALRATA
jgi:hypothetical protein